MDIEPLLRRSEHRKPLVLAAEAAVQDAGATLPDKSQLNRLVAICGEATCAEEIISYLRYQASRTTKPWPREFADIVIAKIKGPLDGLLGQLSAASEADRDRARVAAWRLYAVFLARAFTYASYVRNNQRGNGHGRARS
jgi:hypothetical protein